MKPSDRYELIRRLQEPTYEPYFEAYSEHLTALGEIVLAVGEPLEGNLFFRHEAKNFNQLEAHFLGKRRSLALLANVHTNVDEIGFNAGHSAMLMLSANPVLELTWIDLGIHQYAVPCFEYITKSFGNRNKLIISDSAQAFPMLAAKERRATLFIIDGGHSLNMAETDLFNCIQFRSKGSVILFDDTDGGNLRVLLNMYVAQGLLIPIPDYHGVLNNTNQMLFINNKNY